MIEFIIDAILTLRTVGSGVYDTLLYVYSYIVVSVWMTKEAYIDWRKNSRWIRKHGKYEGNGVFSGGSESGGRKIDIRSKRSGEDPTGSSGNEE